MQIIQTISDYIRKSLMTTQGDLVKRGVAQPVRLGIGTAFQTLQVKEDGSDIVWKEPRSIRELNNNIIRLHLQPIGSWNMDNDQIKHITVSLDVSKVVSITGVVYDDTLSEIRTFPAHYYGDSYPDLDIEFYYNNQISLYRRTGGIFDNNAYKSTTINRGYLLIHYLYP